MVTSGSGRTDIGEFSRSHRRESESDDHELVADNISVALHQHLKGSGCRVDKGDMKLKIELGKDNLVYCPDAMVTRDQSDDAKTFKLRPKLLVEVFSESRHDLIEKRFVYQKIESLEEYLAADQSSENPKARIFRKSNRWEQLVVEGGGEIDLESIGLALRLPYLFL